jgi:hypothetical protein
MTFDEASEGNAAMQARLAREALDGVLRAMRLHADSPDVAAKALVLVGVLAQVRQRVTDCARVRTDGLRAIRSA